MREQEARARKKPQRCPRRRKESSGGTDASTEDVQDGGVSSGCPPARQELRMAALQSALELQRSLQSQALAHGDTSTKEAPVAEEAAEEATGSPI